MTMDPEQFRGVLQNAIDRDVWLAPMVLPQDCAAAWFGGLDSDNIMHAKDGLWTAVAAAHAAAHVALLHCGEVRDTGRFACVDPRSPEPYIRYQVHTLFGEDGDQLPLPLFTSQEEREADKTAEVLLKECHYEGPLPRFPGIHQAFRCLG
jgi:hypothetical protein